MLAMEGDFNSALPSPAVAVALRTDGLKDRFAIRGLRRCHHRDDGIGGLQKRGADARKHEA
jgi:hypothetical protein